MKDDKIKNMILTILEQVDHDIAKEYRAETAEDPESAEEDLDHLVQTAKSYIKHYS